MFVKTLCLSLIVAIGITISIQAAQAAVMQPAEPGCRIPAHATWLDQEKWVWEQICQGNEADLKSQFGADAAKHKLRSAFLRAVLFDVKYRQAIGPQGIRITNAVFDEPLDLRRLTFNRHLSIRRSIFWSQVNLRHARFDTDIDFSDSNFLGKGVSLDVSNAKIAGTLLLDDTLFGSDVNLEFTRIGNNLYIKRVSLGGSLRAALVRVENNVDLSHSTFYGGVNLIGSRIDRSFFANETEVPNKRAIYLNAATIGMNVQIKGNKSHQSSIYLLSLASANIDGSIDISNLDSTKLSLVTTSIGGFVSIQKSSIQNIDARRMRLDGRMRLGRQMRLGGQMRQRYGLVVSILDASFSNIQGSVILRGANIRIVNMVNSRFGGGFVIKNSEVACLIAENLEVDGNVIFVGIKASLLNLVGSKIVGDFGLYGAKIGKMKMADGWRCDAHGRWIDKGLSAERITIAGNFETRTLLNQKTEVFGWIDLGFSNIGGNLDLTAARLYWVNLIGSSTKKEMRFAKNKLNITEWFTCGVQEFDVCNPEIRNGSKRLSPKLILTSARASALVINVKNWEQNLAINISGFKYNRFSGNGVSNNRHETIVIIEHILKLLSRQTKYSPEPYEQLARVATEVGLADIAKRVLYRKEEQKRADLWQNSQYADWFWSIIKLVFIGHGYRVWYSLFWIGGLVLIGALIFIRTPEAKAAGHKYGLAFSLDRLVPLIRLREIHYDIDFQGGLRWPRYYFYLHAGMGYVLASFLIGGLSGLAK